MKYISWLITIPLTVLFLLFILSNRETTTLALWPFATTISAPLYLFFLLTVFVSFMAGLITMWLAQHKHRAAAKHWQREAETLKSVLLESKGALEPPPIIRAISQG
jgi:uncharacterized integral membrane protein